MFHPTHETDIRVGTREERTGEWRATCTFLEVRFATAAEAVAWADRHLSDLSRRYYRAGAVPVPGLITS